MTNPVARTTMLLRTRRSLHPVVATVLLTSALFVSAVPAGAQDPGASHPSEPGLTYLARADFMALVDDGLRQFVQDHPQAREGWWEFTMDDRSIELYDYGDSLQLTFYVDARTLPGDRRDAFLQTVRKRVDERGPLGASSTEVTWYPEYVHLLWVKATYVLDGSFGVAGMKARYDDFIYSYSRDLDGEIHRIMATMGGGAQGARLTWRPNAGRCTSTRTY